MCRSRRLQRCGVKPSEAYGLKRASSRYVANAVSVTDSPWSWEPGNRPETAVLVERGAYGACDLNAPFLNRTFNPVSSRYERHTAWRAGIRWHCLTDGTRAIPDLLSRGWAVADYFEDLRVDIEAEEQDPGWLLTPHVYGGHSDEEITPISSIPALAGWERKHWHGGECQCEADTSFDTQFREYGSPLFVDEGMMGVERANDGSLVHAPYTATFIFHLIMSIGGAYKSRLYDANDRPLSDINGDPLYTMEMLGTPTEIAVRGSYTFDLSQIL